MAEELFIETLDETYFVNASRFKFITAGLGTGSVFETSNVQSRAAW